MSEYLVSAFSKFFDKTNIKKDHIVRNLITDSRTILSPSDSVFFAIKGERHNGHNFIGDLYEKGIRSFVVSEKEDFSTLYPDGNFIYTDNTLEALQKVAAWHRRNIKNTVAAITGSNGKTIVKEWLFHCLSVNKNVIRSPKSYNSQLGVPLSVWLMQPEHELGIFEAGISMPGEMEKLEKIIHPDIGIFTNIGEAHQENFEDLKHKIKEKLKLFVGSQLLIYCKDHALVENEIKSAFAGKKINLFSWSQKEEADLQINNIKVHHTHTDFEAYYGNKKYPVRIPFTDTASLENAIHVLVFALATNETDDPVLAQFSSLPMVAMRLEIKKGFNNCTLINDSYNSDISSLSIALDALNMQSQHKTKTLILSDILQTGLPEKVLYTKIASLVKEKKIDRFIGIGEGLKANSDIFGISSLFFITTEEFLSGLHNIEFRNEAILIKGSRKFEFEKISAAFEEKKHLTRLEINLNALVDNLNFYRSFLKEGTKIMVMVKALSYGSGSYEISNILQFQRVDYLGVAIADEGADLRKAGIYLPIMVMNPDPVSYGKMITFHLEPELYNFTTLKAFDSMAGSCQENAYPVHIKIDTGMRRLGFSEDEIPSVLEILKNSRNIKVKSVFSHLAGSDEEIHDAFTKEQISRFEKVCKKMEDALGYTFIRHILNSSGIERFPESQFEMVRLGIGLYGFSSFNQKKLKNVSTLKSTISQIKKVPANETIGYGRIGKANEDKTIGIVPIGYADGFNRGFSNGKGKILVNGKHAPVIGNICMDMCMVDLEGIKAKEGDEVIIFGDEYPASVLARQIGTIPYEILTGISTRVKRIYYQE